jgi:hypothetical protein
MKQRRPSKAGDRDDEVHDEKRRRRQHAHPAWFIGTALCAVIYAVHTQYALPNVVPASAPPTLFSEERAMAHVLNISSPGEHVVGSAACEEATMGYILSALAALQTDISRQKLPFDLHVRTQNASGAFLVDYRSSPPPASLILAAAYSRSQTSTQTSATSSRASPRAQPPPPLRMRHRSSSTPTSTR